MEAQTLANAYLAIDQNLELVPVINKIDLPSADPEAVRREIKDGLERRLLELLQHRRRDVNAHRRLGLFLGHI